MSSASPDPFFASKQRARGIARERRKNLSDRESRSRQILDHCSRLMAYQQAQTILFYVDVRDEVQTRHALPAAIRDKPVVAVPYCQGDVLELLVLRDASSELETGRFGILEPREALRTLPERQLDIKQIQLVLVPGVAFDRQGGRLGHGQGYYDRLLAGVSSNCTRIGLAFECQLLDHVPRAAHDVQMDFVITERAVYQVAQKATDPQRHSQQQ